MYPALFQFLSRLEKSLPQVMVQFLMDPTAFSEIWETWEPFGQPAISHVYYLTRTYVYYIYRQKQILLGLWTCDNFQTKYNKRHDNAKNLIIALLITLLLQLSLP